MPEWRFKVEQAFPAADEVARFVVGLGLINNEWHRTMKLMPKDDLLDVADDERGIRLMLARQQAATCHEAIGFIADARHHYPKIGEFVDSLGDKAKEHYQQFNEAIDPKSPYYLPWLREHRHITLHVPELHPDRYAHGKDAIANALERAGSLEGTVFTRTASLLCASALRTLCLCRCSPGTIPTS